MATAVQSASSIGESTTTSSTLTAKVSATLLAATQTASTTYAIFASATIRNGTAGAKTNVHLVNTTSSTIYQDLEPAVALVDTEVVGVTALGFYTSASTPAEQTFELQYSAVSGTAKISNAYIWIVKLGSDDFWGESTGKTDATTSYATTATATHTPSSAGDYLIIGIGEALHSSGDRPYARLSVGGSVITAIETVDTPSATTRTSLGLSCVVALTTTSTTISYDIRDASTFSDFYNKRIVALRLDEFHGAWWNSNNTLDSTPATTFESKVSVTQSFAAVEHWCIATIPSKTSSTNSINHIVTTKIDGVVAIECTTRPRQLFGIEGTDSPTMMCAFDGDASSMVAEAGWHFNSSASGSVQYCFITVIQFESSGTTETKSGSDTPSASVTESSTTLATIARADAASTSAAESRDLFVTTSGANAPVTPVLIEASTTLATLSRTDTASVTTSDTSALTSIYTSADTASITLTELSDTITAILSADTVSLSASQSSALAAFLARADTGTVTTSDIAAVLATISSTDSGAIAAITATASIALSTLDAASLSVVESSVLDVLQLLSSTDTASISTADVSALLAILGRADTASITSPSSALAISATLTTSTTAAVTAAAAAALLIFGTGLTSTIQRTFRVTADTRTFAVAARISNFFVPRDNRVFSPRYIQ